jgi:VWFA-related protein
MRRLLSLLACSAAACLLHLEARQDRADQPTFRAGVDIVDVDVSVLDRDRLPIRGLSAADFSVFDDGVRREIVAFSAVDLPAREHPTAQWITDIAPDVADNDFPKEGRLIVVLMDRSIGAEHLRTAQAFAEAVLDQMRPGDMAAVAYSTFGVPQNFTTDRRRLLAAIRQPAAGLPEGDDGAAGECYCGACSLETIDDIAEAMLPVRQRRKVLLVIGTSMSIFSNGICSGVLSPLRDRATRALQAANVTVHQFDPTGLQSLMPSASMPTPFDPNAMRTAAQRALNRKGNLAILPDSTGGRVVGDPLRPADQVATLLRESSSYYVLGFVPGAPATSKRFHRIDVKVNRRDVTLQARRGYYGPAATARSSPNRREVNRLPPVLRTAVEGLWPKSEISLAVTASPIARPKLDASTVATVVAARQEFEGGGPAFFEAPVPTRVNVLVGAFDRRGEALGTVRQTLTLTPRESGPRAFEYEVISSLDLLPGRYEVRAAVEDTRFGRSGSVYTYVDVPDYRKEDVAMSGLMIEAAPARVSAPPTPLSGLVSVVPTARRAFSRTDKVTGFVRVYQGLARPVTPGYVVARIVDDHDRPVFNQESRILSEQFGAGRALDFYVDVPVGRLAAGDYLLTVEARVGNETARRDARFRMVP